MTNSTEENEKSEPEVDNTDLYPYRRGDKPRGFFNKLFRVEERKELDTLKCEGKVYQCVKKSPLVKLMMAALKSAGCEVDIRRHISCEDCDSAVTGGYDLELNQIVICQNNVSSKSMMQGVLSHEMVHMFDYCTNKLTFNNIDHLACTEIRAANLCHCSFLSAWIQGLTSLFNFKQTHQNCVKDKAIKSIMAVKPVTEDVARAAVLRVFDKCYNDLEPVGRRLRRHSDDMTKAYVEGPYYGYVE